MWLRGVAETILFFVFFVSLFMSCMVIYKNNPDIFNSIFNYVNGYIKDPNWTITILLLLVGLVVFYMAAFIVKTIKHFY